MKFPRKKKALEISHHYFKTLMDDGVRYQPRTSPEKVPFDFIFSFVEQDTSSGRELRIGNPYWEEKSLNDFHHRINFTARYYFDEGDSIVYTDRGVYFVPITSYNGNNFIWDHCNKKWKNIKSLDFVSKSVGANEEDAVAILKTSEVDDLFSKIKKKKDGRSLQDRDPSTNAFILTLKFLWVIAVVILIVFGTIYGVVIMLVGVQ